MGDGFSQALAIPLRARLRAAVGDGGSEGKCGSNARNVSFPIIRNVLILGSCLFGNLRSPLPFSLSRSNGLEFHNLSHCDARLRTIVTTRQSNQSPTLRQFFRTLIQGQFKTTNLIRKGSTEKSYPFFRGYENEDGHIFKSCQPALVRIAKPWPLPNNGLFTALDRPHARDLIQNQLILAICNDLRMGGYNRCGSLRRRSIRHGPDHVRDQTREFVQCLHSSTFHLYPGDVSKRLIPLQNPLFKILKVWLNATPSERPCSEYAPYSPLPQPSQVLRQYHLGLQTAGRGALKSL
jgi:hypothetical protein